MAGRSDWIKTSPPTPALMKAKIGMTVGLAIGTALYEAIRHGIAGIDWGKVVVVPLITFALLLLIPNRWLEKKKGAE